MKKIVFKLAILAIAISGIQGCKKGEEDPFLSLRSRKSRLTGEWKVNSYEYKSYEDNVMDYSLTFDGTTMTSSSGDQAPYSHDFTFEKDGTFEEVTVDAGETVTTKGNWAFLGKSKAADMKKKEYILLDATSRVSSFSTSTYGDFNSGHAMSYQLKKLSNKEIIMEYVWEYTDSDGFNIREEESYTLTKK